MARALTTSEAAARLFELGLQNYNHRIIGDNEFTEPFGKSWGTDLNNRHVFSVVADDYPNGQTYIGIYEWNNRNGHRIFSYAKADAKTKKRFMDVMLNILK